MLLCFAPPVALPLDGDDLGVMGEPARSSKSSLAVVYDVPGNLLQVVLPDGTNIEYVVDGLDRRIGKKVNGVLTTGFLYDGQLRVVAGLDGSGSIVSRFVYGESPNSPELMVQDGVAYRVIKDSVGSPGMVVSSAMIGLVATQLTEPCVPVCDFDTSRVGAIT